MNLCAVHTLGLGNGLHRKSSGLSLSAMIEAKIIYQLSDTCTVINFKSELIKLLGNCAREFYLDAVGVVNDFDVTKTKYKLCLFIKSKNHKDSNEHKILEGHKISKHSSQHALEMCTGDSETQSEQD